MVLPIPQGIDPGPASDGVAITPNDTTVFTRPYRFLYIGTAGSLTVTTSAGNTLSFANVVAGELRLAVVAVKATGTTATGIVGMI